MNNRVDNQKKLTSKTALPSRIVRKKRSAFTLVEIMVVVVILGLLAALVIPRIMEQVDEARRTATSTQIKEIETALDMYRLHNSIYPTTQQGLEALIKKPTTSPVPKRYMEGGYLKKVPVDAWGYPFIYRSPGEKGDVDIISTGPDGEEGGEGKNADISNNS